MHDANTQKPWLNHYDRNIPPALSDEDKTFAKVFLEIANCSARIKRRVRCF
jgi:hypothetical protein